jgi:hypothetical protein
MLSSLRKLTAMPLTVIAIAVVMTEATARSQSTVVTSAPKPSGSQVTGSTTIVSGNSGIVYNPATNTTTITSNPTPTATPVSTTTTTTTTVGATATPAALSTDATGQAAKAAQSSQTWDTIGEVAAGAMGAYLTYQCFSAPGPQAHMIQCGMAALSFAEVGILANASSAAGDSAAALSNGSGTTNGTTTTTTGNGTTVTTVGSPSPVGSIPGGTNAPLSVTASTVLSPTQAAAAAKLASAGFTSDGNTISTPNGKSIPASALSSDSGMAAAGFSASDIKSAKESLAAAAQAANQATAAMSKSLTNGDTAGGGRGSASGSSSGEVTDSSGGNSLSKMLGQLRTPASAKAVSKLTKNFNGDPIGVAASNIWDQASSCYLNCPQSKAVRTYSETSTGANSSGK